jgi:hypothetical protein
MIVKRRKKNVEKPTQESTGSLNVDEPCPVKPSFGSGTKGRTNVSRKPTLSATLQINTKRKQAKRVAANNPSMSIVKDESDNDNDPVHGDIDPDEPTYCLCEQVVDIHFKFSLKKEIDP